MFDTGNSGNGYIGAAIDQVDFTSNNFSNNFVDNHSNDNSINNGNEGNNNDNYSYHDYDNSNYSNDEDNSSYNNNKSYNNNNNYNNDYDYNYNNKNNNKNYSFNNKNNYYYNPNNNSKKKNNKNFPFLKPIPVIKINNNSKPINNIIEFSNDNYDYSIESIKKRIYNLQNEIVRDKLYINLIFYDENVTRENKFLYDDLQLNVVGGFYGVRDLNMFNMLIKKLEKNNLPFILLTSGSVFQKISLQINNVNFIKNIVIFCLNKNKYSLQYKNDKKVELITNSILEVKNYLRKKKFNSFEIKMDNQIYCNPLISFYEYEKCYFIFHKALSFFFKEDFSDPIFNEDYITEVTRYIIKDKEYDLKTKNKLIDSLFKLEKSNDFAKEVLKEYSSENGFVYFFNKIMRRIENGILQLSFFIGPMYYSIVRDIKYNKLNGLNKNTTLFRNIVINDVDLNFYYMSIGNIICFPSFTSTSLKNGFSTTNNALKINKINEEKIEIEMILDYKYNSNNISPGVVIGDLSYYKSEKEVLLFPFTFIKVMNIEKINNKYYKIYCEIINRENILEFGLKKNMRIYLKKNNLVVNS